MPLSLWNLGFDPYLLIRHFLFQRDAEKIHETTIRLLKMGLGPNNTRPDDPILNTNVFGVDFGNPIGLAAGLDKHAEVINAVMRFGFGFTELGGVTLNPQDGNPKPRLFRVTEAKAIINRFGFNSVGLDVFAERVKRWRESPKHTRKPVGVNIGLNKDSTNASDDYSQCLIRLAPYVDFVTLNVSSPNTPGLRALQGRDQLMQLVTDVMMARQAHAPHLPVLIKIAPDLDPAQQEDIAEVALATNIQGMIVGNTSLMRPNNIPTRLAKEAGGLSGKPLFGLSTHRLGNMYKLTEGKIPMIGAGGVSSGADAYKKIRAGASLVQLYSALVYEGPMIVQRIKTDLAKLLRRDGFSCVAEAVGADHKL